MYGAAKARFVPTADHHPLNLKALARQLWSGGRSMTTVSGVFFRKRSTLSGNPFDYAKVCSEISRGGSPKKLGTSAFLRTGRLPRGVREADARIDRAVATPCKKVCSGRSYPSRTSIGIRCLVG